MHLDELRLYRAQHAQLETEVARMAESDEDCRRLIRHPGIGPFVAVAIKSRVATMRRGSRRRSICARTRGRARRGQLRGAYLRACPRQTRRCHTQVRPDVRRDRRREGQDEHGGQEVLPQAGGEGPGRWLPRHHSQGEPFRTLCSQRAFERLRRAFCHTQMRWRATLRR
jgi:hypothetical protein